MEWAFQWRGQGGNILRKGVYRDGFFCALKGQSTDTQLRSYRLNIVHSCVVPMSYEWFAIHSFDEGNERATGILKASGIEGRDTLKWSLVLSRFSRYAELRRSWMSWRVQEVLN